VPIQIDRTATPARIDFDHLHEHGWVRIERAVPAERCAAVVEAMRRELGVASWRSGRAPAGMRPRPGYDRIEPWPPADLTLLGRRLLGLDNW